MEGGEILISRSNLTPGYAFYLMGMIFYLGFIRFLRKCRVDPLEDYTKKRGIEFDSQIDMEVSKIYSECPKFQGSVLVFGIFVIVVFGRNRLDPLLVVLLLGISPFIYWGALMISKVSETRDRAMAESIMEKSLENGFENIVISCGQAHVEGVAAILEENDWDVCQNSSNYTGWSHIRLLDPRIWISWTHTILKCAYDRVQNQGA